MIILRHKYFVISPQIHRTRSRCLATKLLFSYHLLSLSSSELLPKAIECIIITARWTKNYGRYTETSLHWQQPTASLEQTCTLTYLWHLHCVPTCLYSQSTPPQQLSFLHQLLSPSSYEQWQTASVPVDLRIFRIVVHAVTGMPNLPALRLAAMRGFLRFAVTSILQVACELSSSGGESRLKSRLNQSLRWGMLGHASSCELEGSRPFKEACKMTRNWISDHQKLSDHCAYCDGDADQSRAHSWSGSLRTPKCLMEQKTSLSVFKHICSYSCMHAWMYVYVCMYACMHVCRYVCMKMYEDVFLYVHVHVCICMHIHVYVHVWLHVYVYI